MNIRNTEVQSEVYGWLFEKLMDLGLSEKVAHSVNSVLLIIVLGILLYVVDYLFSKVLLLFILKTVRKTKTKFDDFLIRNKVVKYFMHIITVVIAKYFLPLIFMGFPKWIGAMVKITDIVLIVTIGLFINGIIKSVRDWFKTKKPCS